jgi:hypothetical protein
VPPRTDSYVSGRSDRDEHVAIEHFRLARRPHEAPKERGASAGRKSTTQIVAAWRRTESDTTAVRPSARAPPYSKRV